MSDFFLKGVVTYDGTLFYGWQKAEKKRTVQKSIEDVLEKIVRQKIKVEAASRTDKGVHARGQVVSFALRERVNPSQLLTSLNRLLPFDVRFLSLIEVQAPFRVSLDVVKKRYLYKVHNHRILSPLLRHTHWHVYHSLSLDRMRKSCKYLVGNKDFKLFEGSKHPRENTIATVFDVSLEQGETELLIRLEADRFLYHMARKIVGCLIYIGSRRLSLEDIQKALDLKKNIDIFCAPAHGLTLEKIYYTVP